MLHTAKYMHQILNHSMDSYEEIFQEIDTTNLVEQKGIIYAGFSKHNRDDFYLEIDHMQKYYNFEGYKFFDKNVIQ